MSHRALLGQLGAGAFERYEHVRDDGGKLPRRRHIGWRWPCDCSAFARPEGDYLWVPCRNHHARTAAPHV